MEQEFEPKRNHLSKSQELFVICLNVKDQLYNCNSLIMKHSIYVM